MTENELYRIASSKPVITEEEEMDNITEDDIEVMTDSAWRKINIFLAGRITEAENIV